MSFPVHELDVRPLLASGQPPIDAILAAVAALPPGGALRLLAPFEPQPLYAKLAGLGLDHCTLRQPDATFAILFSPRTVHLDLRQLEPPGPMQRTLEAAVLPPRAASSAIVTASRRSTCISSTRRPGRPTASRPPAAKCSTAADPTHRFSS